MILARLLRDQSGGALTEEAARLCEATIGVYRKHFLGNAKIEAMRRRSVDPLGYYSQALEMLGVGIEYTWTVSATAEGMVFGGEQRKARFASVEEAQQAVANEIAQRGAGWGSRYW
jgi:hypothetical protein